MFLLRSYPIGKLCAEDPISVSRKFSKKFHNFFNTVILKGEVLGKVLHSFWKKNMRVEVLLTIMSFSGLKMLRLLVKILTAMF